MKKIVAPLLILFLLFSSAVFVSCGDNEPLEGDFNVTVDDEIEEDEEEEDDDDDENYGNVKLLRKVVINENHLSHSYNFFYNSKRQIEQITHNNGLVEKFLYNENDGIDRIVYSGNDIPQGSYKEFVYIDQIIAERQDYTQNEMNARQVYHYDADSLIYEIDYHVFEDKEGKWIQIVKDIFTYDETGNCLIRTNDFADADEYDIQTTYTYDNSQNPFSDFNPTIVLIDGLSSFVNNPQSEVKFVILTNEVLSVKNHEYSYDAGGFPLTRTTTNEDGQVIQTAVYEYYN